MTRRKGTGSWACPLLHPAEKLAAAIHAIAGAPGVLVLLGAAQEVERRRAVADGSVESVGDDERADAQLLQIRLIAAEVVVNRATMGESIEDGDDALVHAGGVHPQRACAEKVARYLAVELLDGRVAEHAGQIAAPPARGVQEVEGVEQGVEVGFSRFFDAHLAEARQRATVVAQLLAGVCRQQSLQPADGAFNS